MRQNVIVYQDYDHDIRNIDNTVYVVDENEDDETDYIYEEQIIRRNMRRINMLVINFLVFLCLILLVTYLLTNWEEL